MSATRDAKDAAKSCELVRAKILVAKDQDRMLGEGLMDPGDDGRVERCGKVDITNLGAERLPEGTKGWDRRHLYPPIGLGQVCSLPAARHNDWDVGAALTRHRAPRRR